LGLSRQNANKLGTLEAKLIGKGREGKGREEKGREGKGKGALTWNPWHVPQRGK
jgi:hypothetical protein